MVWDVVWGGVGVAYRGCTGASMEWEQREVSNKTRKRERGDLGVGDRPFSLTDPLQH